MKNSHIITAAAAALIFCGCVSLKNAGSGAGAGARDIIVKAAISQLDMFYAYGKQDKYKGFDCSGLAQYAYKEAGINIPRTVKLQYEKSSRVSRGNLKPGDLVFFTTYAPGATHVGIYTGDGKFIHSPTTGKKVDISELSNVYWNRAFISGGRYISE